MNMNQPVDIRLRLVVAVLEQQSRELVFGAVEPLPGQLHAHGFAAARGGPVREEVADLRVEVGVEDGDGGEHRVEGVEGGFSRAEQVFEEVGRDVRVQPEETDLAVVDEVCAAFFDSGKGGADRGWDDQVAGFRGGETCFRGEVVYGDYARVEEERKFEGTGGFEEAHGVGTTVGWFISGWWLKAILVQQSMDGP